MLSEIFKKPKHVEIRLCLWTGRFWIVKMTILHKTIYRLNEILIKIITDYFVEIENYFKIYMDMQMI